MVLVKKWIFTKPFEGDAKRDNFELVQEDTEPRLGNGDVFIEAIYLSVDPYMRVYTNAVGDAVRGEQVARVLQSKHSSFPVGTEVLAQVGWRSHTLIKDTSKLKKLPDHGDLPSSVALGVLGMPGATAHIGYHEIMRANPGDNVVVSTASGAVGSIVGQIAKIKGCKVIGFAGAKAKCDWLENDLKFDAVFNYKEIDVDKALNQAAPNGVDCYWDNVGGDFTSKVIDHMAEKGRVCVCGVISVYSKDADKQPSGPYPFRQCLAKSLRIEGFKVFDYLDKYEAAHKELYRWIQEGKLQYKESVTQGFEHMADAFLGLFKGANIGKAIVKV